MKTDYSIRKMFLEEFVLNFVSEYKKRYSQRIISPFDNMQESKKIIETPLMDKNAWSGKVNINLPQNENPEFLPAPVKYQPIQPNQIKVQEIPQQFMQRRAMPMQRPMMQFQRPMPSRFPVNMPPQRGPPPVMEFPQQPEQHVILGPPFGKIISIIKDPSVFSLECPGPGKNILANKSGAIQATPVTLSKNEIEDIMSEVSQKTKIPVIPGVFKAAMGDFIITAVVSEFVGTRFIIQKRMPSVPQQFQY